jgi:hypothetical protein
MPRFFRFRRNINPKVASVFICVHLWFQNPSVVSNLPCLLPPALAYIDRMGDPGNRGLKLFLEFWLLIAFLAGFNFYMYHERGRTMFLIVGLVSAAVFIGYGLFYLLYVRKGEQ